MEFQQRLYELRKQSGLSQEGLADLLGVTRQAVQKWESGASRPDMDNLAALARYFNVTLDYLVTGQEATPPDFGPAPTIVNNYYNTFQYEYKSSRTLFGLPLVHIRLGHRGMGVAKGIFAVGNIAVGFFTLGGLSLGLFSFGGISLGLLLSLGGLSLGGIAIGGCAVGLLALGGCAVGWMAVGGGAFGAYAVGGGAVASQIAVGGSASAPLAIGKESVSGTMTFLWDSDPALMREAIHQSLAHLPGILRNFVEGFLLLLLPR